MMKVIYIVSAAVLAIERSCSTYSTFATNREGDAKVIFNEHYAHVTEATK